MAIPKKCGLGNDEITQRELNDLERALDSFFQSLNIDVNFTKHFLDRVNDRRNKKQITLCELSDIFRSLYRKHDLHLLNLVKRQRDIEKVIKSISTSINIPLAFHWNKRGNELELIAKTVMRKKGFKTKDKVLTVESFRSFREKNNNN